MSVVVRPAAMPDEVQAVNDLMVGSVGFHRERWPADFAGGSDGDSAPPLSDQLLEMAADPSVAILVAEEEGSVVGMLTGSVADKPTGGTLRYAGPIAFVADLAVAPTHQNRGIGAELMASFESWARSRGAAHLRLFVHDGNAAAESLYARTGYRRVHIEMRKDL